MHSSARKAHDIYAQHGARLRILPRRQRTDSRKKKRLMANTLSKSIRLLEVCVFVFLLAGVAQAQDRRVVREPVIPPVCARLGARLIAESGETLAPTDESKLDTTRIQVALDHCARGHAVELEAQGARTAFLSGPLDLRKGVTLLIGKGAILFGSRNPRDYDLSPGSCGILSKTGHGCKALISGDHAPDAGVMGDGVIDGRGGATILGQRISWWQLAREAQVKNTNQNCPRLIVLSHCDNFTLYRITLENAPNFHVFYGGGKGFTAWGVIINTPKTARNTDGIDPSSSTNVTITHCFIHAGDDDVAIKAGNAGPATHISIVHNHFYTGHGVSIGSETNGGASDIVVHDLSIDGADNGIRIKSNSSRGGHVHGVIYKNVCIRDTKNPILMDSNYSFYGTGRNELPAFDGILLQNVHISGPGRITLDGYDAAHRLGIRFDNVTLDSPARIKISAVHAEITLGPGPVNFRPAGEDVTVKGNPGQGSAYSCENAFPPLPEKPRERR
jgi:polygalacturonase